MTKNNFVSIVSFLLFIISVLHILRVFYGWESQIGNFVVPMWFSYVAVLLTGYLSFQGFRLAKKT